MLGKQIRFDLSIFRHNPIRFLVFVLQITWFGLVVASAKISQDIIGEVTEIVMCVTMTCFIVAISTVFEKQSFDFAEDKLMFYPTRRSFAIGSKAVLVAIFVAIQILWNHLAVYIGMQIGNGLEIQMLYKFNVVTIVAGIWSFVTLWGVRSMRLLVVVSFFIIPFLFGAMDTLNVFEWRMSNIIIMVTVVVVESIINVVSFVKTAV
ncbi:hypothetical protein [Anaerosporobacter sp.]|uniref:hypothetical protein n=1 Tax=Anaerosporobacter sp. TaxID=1872529 RepID=UPI00286F5D59|nr:hypothetical protein [Anaerosporobacter sp.]